MFMLVEVPFEFMKLHTSDLNTCDQVTLAFFPGPPHTLQTQDDGESLKTRLVRYMCTNYKPQCITAGWEIFVVENIR